RVDRQWKRCGLQVLLSGNQLIQRSTANPPSKTSTGIQKCVSRRTTVTRLCVVVETLSSFNIVPPKGSGFRENSRSIARQLAKLIVAIVVLRQSNSVCCGIAAS